jgi:hypothetical protein
LDLAVAAATRPERKKGELMALDNSVTEQVAEWIVKAEYDDIPTNAVERVRNLVLDSLGNKFAGLTVSTG